MQSRLEGSESTTVTVGPQDAATTWHLPKALLIHKSPFFAAALNGPFAEAKLNSVVMLDDDPNVFRLWVEWLFVGQITCTFEHINNVLVEAWILGDKLGCHIFQNVVMIELLKSHSPDRKARLLEPSTLRAAYEGSAPGSKLRKWALDSFLFETRDTKYGSASTLQRNISWVSEIKDIEDFSQEYMEACVGCSLESGPANPWLDSTQYMEILDSTAR